MVLRCFFSLFGYPCYIISQCGIYFSLFLVLQTIINLLVKLYKEISIKYISKQNITLLSSMAHGFFDILTAAEVNDLNIASPKRPLSLIQSSQFPLSTISENPLDESPDNSDDPINPTNKPSRIISPPYFYTKRPKRIPKVTKFKLFSKRKRSEEDEQTDSDNSITKTSPLTNSTLPQYSTVKSDSNYYPLNTTFANNDNESPVKVYSKTNYFLLRYLSKHGCSDFPFLFRRLLLYQKFCSLQITLSTLFATFSILSSFFFWKSLL